MDAGWIKIHRSLLDWEWYSDANVMRVFLHLLLKANIEDKKWMGKVILRGQLVTNLANLSFELGLSVQQLRTVLSKLETTGEINKQTTNKYTIITICNYVKYQSKEQIYSNQATNEQQTNNNQITTTKEYKEYKNIYSLNTREENFSNQVGQLPLEFHKQAAKTRKELEWTDEQKEAEIEQFKKQLLGSETDMIGLMKVNNLTLPEAQSYIERHADLVKFNKTVYSDYSDYRGHVSAMYSHYKKKTQQNSQYDPRRGQEPSNNIADFISNKL